MLIWAKMKVKVFPFLWPKAPEHSVVLWSPRRQQLFHPAMDWLSGELLVQLISVYIIIICFVCRPALKYNWYGTKSASLFFLSLWTKGGWVSGAIGDPSNLLPNCSKDLLSHRHHFLQLHLRHQGPAVDPGEYSSEGAEGSKLDNGQLILHYHHLGGRCHGGGGGYQSCFLSWTQQGRFIEENTKIFRRHAVLYLTE